MDKIELNNRLERFMIQLHEPISNYNGNPYMLTSIFKVRLKKIAEEMYDWGYKDANIDKMISKATDTNE